MAVQDELARRVLEQLAIARLGEIALECSDPDAMMRATVELVAKTLDVPYAGITELNAAGDMLISRATYGWPDGLVGTEFSYDETQSGYTLTVDEPVVVEDYATESRFQRPPTAAEFGVHSGVTAAIRGRSGVLGVLAATGIAPRQFSEEHLAFMQSAANIVGAVLDRMKTEERMRHLALHDELTGLPNRALFHDRLEHALSRAIREPLAVLFVDIDDFKNVNETLGHGAGDELLCDVATRISAALRPQDTVARFGGDEFVVLCDDLSDPSDAMALAGRVREAFGQAFIVDGAPRQITASVGVVVNVGQTTDSQALIRDADAAVHRAKERGRGWIESHDAAARRRLLRRLGTERDLQHAIEAGQIVPHFQPIVDLATREWRHMEALARWEHPERGLLPPAAFIEIAEETGLIAALGELVLLKACRAAAGWPGGKVGVNVSQRQLDVDDFGRSVTDALEATALAPERLTLELTETALFDASPGALRALRELTAMGVELALDDFGTGYSSLSHLRRFRVTAVKIDRSFVSGVHEPGHDQVIVRAVISMAAEMGIDVVAEGVETVEQADALRTLGCPHAQGYLFARPAPLAVLMAALPAPVLPAP